MSSDLVISVLPHQREFINSTARHTGLVAGYGAGKSEAAVKKTFIKKLRYPNIPVAYYLPTYGLIKDVALPKFEKLFIESGIKYEINKTDSELICRYGKIIFRSMDNPDRIIGYEVGYSLIDEVDILPLDKMNDVYARILGRNRAVLPSDELNQTDVVGTPEGFKWFYNYYVRNGNKNRHLIKAKTTDNPFLPPDYIDSLKDTYTNEQLEAYLNGEFINLNSGTVYKNFNRKLNHSDETIQPNDVLHIGLDFNIMHMAAVVHVIRDGNPVAVAELVDIFDTQDMGQKIKELFKNQVVIYPDASGQNRKSAGGESDFMILKKMGFQIRVGNVNPFVKDRVNTMNMNFCDNNGLRKYKVNTYSCPRYTEALEQLSYKNGDPDKSSGFDHVTDAGGYFITQAFSMKQPRRGQR